MSLWRPYGTCNNFLDGLYLLQQITILQDRKVINGKSYDEIAAHCEGVGKGWITSTMRENCNSIDCIYACYCSRSNKCMTVTKETKKGIANSVAHFVYNDWRILSCSSLLESDGKRLEKVVHEQQKAEGFIPCFKAPY
jgi:hypothetical protein